jgi:predicted XRE-type DNA-binding protein
MKRPEIVEESSGNVFADIGVTDPEETLAKAELAHRISLLIRKRRLTQVRAAKILGTDQARVSDLVRGRLTAFSTERLLRFLANLGCDVQIVITPRSPNRRGRLKVVAAA